MLLMSPQINFMNMQHLIVNINQCEQIGLSEIQNGICNPWDVKRDLSSHFHLEYKKMTLNSEFKKIRNKGDQFGIISKEKMEYNKCPNRVQGKKITVLAFSGIEVHCYKIRLCTTVYTGLFVPLVFLPHSCRMHSMDTGTWWLLESGLPGHVTSDEYELNITVHGWYQEPCVLNRKMGEYLQSGIHRGHMKMRVKVVVSGNKCMVINKTLTFHF